MCNHIDSTVEQAIGILWILWILSNRYDIIEDKWTLKPKMIYPRTYG